MSLKAPFHSYKSTDDRDWPICCSLSDAESTGFGPRMLRAAFGLYSQSNISGHVLMRAQVGEGGGSERADKPPFFPRQPSKSLKTLLFRHAQVGACRSIYRYM